MGTYLIDFDIPSTRYEEHPIRDNPSPEHDRHLRKITPPVPQEPRIRCPHCGGTSVPTLPQRLLE